MTVDDTVMMEARNLRNMTLAQTPLLGEENTPMHVAPGGGTGFEGATPRHQVAFTPNPLATPRNTEAEVPGATPRTTNGTAATPLRTPRDNLSINTEGYTPVGDTPREQRARTNLAKRSLQEGFKNLPAPENNFELLVPDADEGGEELGEAQISEEDAAERDARLKRLHEEEEKKALARRSQSVQQGLPRPANVEIEVLFGRLNVDEGAEEKGLKAAQRLINLELVELLRHDSLSFPLPGTTRPGGELSNYEPPRDGDIDAAKVLIRDELEQALGKTTATQHEIEAALTAHTKTLEHDPSISWATRRKQLVFDVSARNWTEPNKLSLEERIAGYTSLLSDNRETISKAASKAAKVEKKLNVVLGGYQNRSQKLIKRITDAFEDLQRTKIESNSFSNLHAHEVVGGPARVASLKEEVDRLERRERDLQARYAELDAARREGIERIGALEERLMAEAEAVNEAALAQLDSN